MSSASQDIFDMDSDFVDYDSEIDMKVHYVKIASEIQSFTTSYREIKVK